MQLRAYIAHARTFNPHVPVELSNYIASAYAEMRQDELDAGDKAMVRLFNVPDSTKTCSVLCLALRATRLPALFYQFCVCLKLLRVYDGQIRFMELAHYFEYVFNLYVSTGQ